MKYIFYGGCSISSPVNDIGLEYGFLTTGSSGVNDGHYEVLTMGIVSTS